MPEGGIKDKGGFCYIFGGERSGEGKHFKPKVEWGRSNCFVVGGGGSRRTQGRLSRSMLSTEICKKEGKEIYSVRKI